MIADAVTVLIWVALGIIAVGFIMGQVLKSQQKSQGMARCYYCNARLKFQGYSAAQKGSGVAGYATVCRKCGREQPTR